MVMHISPHHFKVLREVRVANGLRQMSYNLTLDDILRIAYERQERQKRK